MTDHFIVKWEGLAPIDGNLRGNKKQRATHPMCHSERSAESVYKSRSKAKILHAVELFLTVFRAKKA